MDQGVGEGERPAQAPAAEKELAIKILSEGEILSPEPRRRAVRMTVEKLGASERFACKGIGQNRAAFRKRKPDLSFEEAKLRVALRAVAVEHPAWGWRKAR